MLGQFVTDPIQFVTEPIQFVTDQMQIVREQIQIVNIAGAGVEPNWWWGGCVVAFAAGVLGVLLGEVCRIVTSLVAKCCGGFVLGWFCFLRS